MAKSRLDIKQNNKKGGKNELAIVPASSKIITVGFASDKIGM
jgi:hypothetical protein